ncbi:hypothetical protein DUNSADRAFT_12281 [Dunaliella salina]|uniref:Encoded protein n=1 Tax=Dunaliella salina TaxID=3046 RepID=A0ABQ7H3Z8_DUNSA|nr:hypothetical protein DUNSADRAFT_12281 [Dunaliella salina]|eukprot:KAF5841583.1 hypothetical protein DUNSADRAFT_12281 [Dunaliella salina]
MFVSTQADPEGGSLQQLLDALLAVSTLNKKAAAVLGEELPNPDKVLFARAARSETPRSEHARSWHTSTAEQPRHSVTDAWQVSHCRSATFLKKTGLLFHCPARKLSCACFAH